VRSSGAWGLKAPNVLPLPLACVYAQQHIYFGRCFYGQHY
jgi:hypothetical protein